MDQSSIGADREPPKCDLADLLPEVWGFRQDASDVWLAGFRLLLAPVADLDPEGGPLIADLVGCRIVVMMGACSYVSPGTVRVGPWWGTGELRTEPILPSLANLEGAFLLIAVPFSKSPDGTEEGTARGKVESALALVRLRLGRNAAYERIFENIVSSAGERTVATPALENPLWFGPPTVSRASVGQLADVSNRVEESPEDLRGKILESLWWIQASEERSGVEGFIFRWIAIETLAMTGAGDLESVKRSIEKIYGLTPGESGERFSVGKLARLRGAILHSGRRPALTGELLQYVTALYHDLLLDTLGLPAEGHAQKELERRDPLGTLNAALELLQT